MLHVSLGLRQYSPKLELYRQLSNATSPAPPAGACCWAVVDGRLASDAAGVAAALGAAGGSRAAGSAEVFPFDHVYQPPGHPPLNASDPGVLTAVLYAPLGSACGSEMHRALARAAADMAARPGAGQAQRGGC